MNRSGSILLTAAFLMTMAASCKKDKNNTPDPGPGGTTKEKYLISGMAITGATSGSSYVLTADDLSAGTVSTTWNGVEMDLGSGLVQNNTMFSIAYGLSGQGPVIPYKLGADGKLVKGNTVNVTTANVFGTFNKDAIITCAVPRDINSPIATFTVLDALNPQIKSTASINTANMLSGTGEMAYFTGLFQVGDKVFAPFMSIKGTADDGFGTKFLDNSWIAVFSYPGLTLEKIIKDDRTSYIGAYFGMYGVAQIESGDVYSFSTAVAGSTKPSAALKIKKGTTEFDATYFFNLETASGGYKVARMTYVSGNLFLAEMYAEQGKSAGKVKLALIDVDKKTVEWVSGSPTYNLGLLSTAFYVEKDKANVLLTVTGDTGVTNIYKVNVREKTATKGAEVKGLTVVTAVSKLTY